VRALPVVRRTSGCNLRCTYCSKADRAYDALPFVNTHLSDALLAKLYAFCKANGVREVSFSGVGETAQFEGWADRLAAFLDDPEIKVYLVSNFARPLVASDLEALRKVYALQVSFDSADPEVVREMRSKARLSIITDNIRKAIAAGAPVFVNCTLSRQNIGHLAPLAVLCRELGVARLLVGEMMLINPSTLLEPLGALSALLAAVGYAVRSVGW
jgi:MoaA/NifB/PqqE/SkfB family radical SAM enzyme